MNFWNTVTDYAKDAAEFIMGTKEYEGDDFTGEYTGGLALGNVYEFGKTAYGYVDSFLDSELGSVVKSGAKAYVASQDKDARRPFQAPQLKLPKIERTASTVRPVSLSALRNPVGVNNPQVQTAIRRISGRNNFNPQIQRIMQQNMTARQGRRTVGVGSASLPRVAVTPAAAVRRETTSKTV